MSAYIEHRYRAEVDGLRALAVVAVVLFHAGLGCPGGYVGVDVFFVVSGYLITGLILKDLSQGEFTLLRFWERRARRIIPALTAVTLAVLAAGWFLLLPKDYKDLGSSAAAQALFVANFHFWRGSGYFSGPADEKPLLHTWSLAVEEQFYLIVPLALLALYRFPQLRRRAILLVLSLTFLCITLAASIYGVRHHPTATFYLLPTRAWELLCGAVLTVLPPSCMPGRRMVNEALSYLGLLGILLPVLFYNRETPFPGLAAVPVCFGTALIIWTNSGCSTAPYQAPGLPSLGKILSAPPLVFVGLISYSLYLWHWPLLAFSTYWALGPLSLAYRLVIVGVSMVLAVISWRFVECPFRHKRFCRSQRSVLAFAGAGLATVFVLGGMAALLDGYPKRLSKEALAFANAKSDRAFINELGTSDVVGGKLIHIGDVGPAAPIKLLVWGDSHAMAAMPAFDALCKQWGVGGIAATHSSTAPVLHYSDNPSLGFKGAEATCFSEAVLNYVKSQKIPNVVLAARWSGYFHYESSKNGEPDQDLNPEDSQFAHALIETVQALRQAKTKVWVLEEIPTQPVDVPKLLARCAILKGDERAFGATLSEHLRNTSSMERLKSALVAAGAQLLDAAPLLYDSGTKRFRIANGRTALYCDVHHLSVKGALFIRSAFNPIFQ